MPTQSPINLLHGEFAVGNVIAYQVGQMVADLFGAKRGDTRCLFSSGGTGSLILACKIYQEWGIENKGHRPGQSVILAPDTIHAAVLKAKKYFINIILVKTDDDGKVDMNDLRTKVTKYEKDLVAIFGTAPAYPRGTVNPIKEMAEVAYNHNVGFHVDCCLGAFVINFHPDYDTDYFRLKGVTTISADPHKFAEAPKGSSVLMCKKLGKKNLTYYSAKINAKPFWSGGVYGSLTEPGSQTIVHIFEAYIALLVAGKRGLREIAEGIFACIKEMKGRIQVDLKHQIQLVGDGKVNVFAFRVHPALRLEKGASYALSHELKTRKFVLNNMKGNFIHFCITSRVTGDEDVVDKFIRALRESMGAVMELDKEVKSGEKQFPGDAGLYGDLETACTPKRKEMSKGEFFENFAFGERGAVDKVAGHFGAILDPFQFDEK